MKDFRGLYAKLIDPALIAVPFSDRTSPSTITRAKKMGMGAAELRIDLFSSYEKKYVLREIEKFGAVRVIATIRSKKEGGQWAGSDAQRLDLYKAVMPAVDYVDVEFSSKKILAPVIAAARASKTQVIVSFHDFKKTPSMSFLQNHLHRVYKAGADIAKIAVMARSYKDVKNLAALTAKNKKKKIIVIAMGEKGAISRVLFPRLGSCMTFASIGQSTAPGQMDLTTTTALLKKIS